MSYPSNWPESTWRNPVDKVRASLRNDWDRYYRYQTSSMKSTMESIWLLTYLSGRPMISSAISKVESLITTGLITTAHPLLSYSQSQKRPTNGSLVSSIIPSKSLTHYWHFYSRQGECCSRSLQFRQRKNWYSNMFYTTLYGLFR